MSLYFPGSQELSRHDIFPGVSIATCAGEKMMLSHVDMQPHSEVAEHSHPHEQVGMVLEGSAVFYVGTDEKMMGPGDMYRIPGGVKHRVVTREQPLRALDVFYPVREDYR